MKRLSAVIILFLIFISGFCSGQYWDFGQNKVQYKGFDWKVIDDEGFSVLYYSGGEEIARFGYKIISESYKRLTNSFNNSPDMRVPVLIYKSHNDFEQTNVTLSLIDENTGGFTEIYKTRVVVPFDGSYEDFRHVLTHELTHAFQFGALRGGGLSSVLALNLSQIPLWFLEGMAEYFSIGWNLEAGMVIRDALYWDKIRPISKLYEIEGSYLMYKEGQSILHFIANRYGEKKIGEIFRRLRGVGSLSGALEGALGIDEEELNRLWLQDLKFRYWSECAGKLPVPEDARRLTDRGDDYAFNTAPAISPDASEIVFLSDRDDYESMYLMSSIDGRIKSKLIGGGRTQAFESFHIMQGGISWSPDGKKIAFIAKAGGKDVIYIMNPHNRKVSKKLVPELDRVFSPCFSPNGKELVIRGVKDGAADIYIISIKTGELEQLTDDIYDDLTPSWLLDGSGIVFSSDRPLDENGRADSAWTYGDYAIFKVDISDNHIQRIPIPIHKASYMASPLYAVSDSGDTNILFVSNHRGTNNLFKFNLDNQQLFQLTDVIGGIFTPSLSRDARYLAFSIYSKGGWDIYTLKNPLSKGKKQILIAQARVEKDTSFSLPLADTVPVPEAKDLGFRISPDWGGGGISVSTDGSYLGYLQLAVSDWLGNHQVYMETSSPENLLANFYVSYLYLPRRLDIGMAFVKQEYYYYPSYALEYYPYYFVNEKDYGGAVLMQYPFDKFRRLEWQWQLTLKEEHHYLSNNFLGCLWYYTTGPSVSFVTDNAIWGATGPQNGERSKLTISSNLPLESIVSPVIAYNYYSVDLRKYWKITGNYSFACRLMNVGVWGWDVDSLQGLLSISGVDYLRGYEPGEVVGKNIGLLNFEFRYPFVEQVKIAFPLPILISGIRGASFLDLGYGKDALSKVRFFDDGGLCDLKMGFGTGARMRLSQYLILKFDVAWNTDLINTSGVHYHWSFTSEF